MRPHLNLGAEHREPKRGLDLGAFLFEPIRAVEGTPVNSPINPRLLSSF